MAAPVLEEADEVPPLGLWLPFDVEELDVDALALAEADAVGETDPLPVGLADVVGLGLGLRQLVAWPFGLGVFLPVALLLAVAETVEEALFVGLLVGLAVAVAVALAVPLVLLLELALLLDGLPLGLPLVLLDGLAGGPTGPGLGCANLLAAETADGEGLGGHAVRVGLWCAVGAPLWLPPPSDKPGTPVPAAFPPPLAPLLVVSPTAVLNWTSASCSGGIARAIPMANTAQAIARAGRSSPSRQSRGERRP